MNTRQRRFLPVAALLLSVVALGARAGEDPVADPKPAAGWSVAPLLPSDTLFFIQVPDVQKMIERSKQTGMYQIFANPDLQSAFGSQLMQAKFGMAAAEAGLGMKISDIVSMFTQGELTIALLGLDKTGGDGKPIPDLLVAVQGRDKSVALLDEINKRVDQLQQQAGGVLEISQLPVGDTTVKSVRVPAQPLSLHYMLCDGTVVVASGEGRLEKILAVREKMKAEPKPGADTIGGLTSYSRTVQKAGATTDLMIFANIAELMKNPLLDLKNKNEALAALGLDAVTSVAYSLEIKDKGIREVAYVDAPAANRKGMMSLMDGEQLDQNALAAAPKNSVFALATKFTLDKVFEKLLDLAAIENPNAKTDIEAWLAQKGQALGIDIKKEVFNALTGQSVFSISMQAHHPKLAVAFPQVLLSYGVKDATALKNIITALRNAGKDDFEYSQGIVDGNEIVSVHEKFAQGREPIRFAYCVTKSDLLVTLYPLALRQELARRAQNEKSGVAPTAGSLSDDADFKSAAARLASKPGAMFYADTGAIAVALYDTLIPVAQLQPRNPKVDVNNLPTSDVLLQNLGGTVFGLTADNDGIVAEGYSPTGVVSFMSMLVPVALQARMNNRRQARENAQEGQEIMGIIGQSLQAYARDNNGALPPALKDLHGKYLDNGTRIDDVVYLGKQEAANRIVAHTSEKQRGPISAVLQDGTVVRIPRMQFGKALKEGYTPAPGTQPAAADAVKPPKAPDGNF